MTAATTTTATTTTAATAAIIAENNNTATRSRFGWCEMVSAALLLIAGVSVPATLIEAA